jgi:MFS transporter, AAHS family, 4-hydroxybenzoate transporter
MSATAVDIQSLLNHNRSSRLLWSIFVMCFCIVLMDGFDTAAIGFIAPSLLGEWHIAKPALAPVLSAALFGLAFGAISAGPISDRFGRRLPLIVAVTLFGAACLASSLSTSLDQLTIFRFITGLGLGAAMPNAVTLMGEFSPDRRRATLINLMFCGFPLGAALGGFLAAWLIPQFGWRSVLMLGGTAPLLLVLLLIARLPESVRFMFASNQPIADIRALLKRLTGSEVSSEQLIVDAVDQQAATVSGVRLILSSKYMVGSAMLWVAYFMGLVIFYASVNWMPLLFKDAGLSPTHSALISALFPLGGVGAVASGLLMDRINPNRIVAIAYGLTAVAVFLIGRSAGAVPALVFTVFLAGVFMNTAQSSLPALAAAFYPTQGRATGVAWMLGIGRFGGIAGSFLVAELMRRQLSFTAIFTILAATGLVASAALVIKLLASTGNGATSFGGINHTHTS